MENVEITEIMKVDITNGVAHNLSSFVAYNMYVPFYMVCI